MKKFLSSMATLLLLMQVVLPGAVAAQEAEAAGVDTSVSVSTAPSVESSNADNAADSQPSNEGAQSEGQDSVSLLNQVSEVLSKTTEVIEEVAASLATDFTKALEGVAEKVMDTFTKSDNQENSETSEENSETLSGASLPETEDQTGATQTENQTGATTTVEEPNSEQNQETNVSSVLPSEENGEATDFEAMEEQVEEVEPLYYFMSNESDDDFLRGAMFARGGNPGMTIDDFNTKWNEAPECGDPKEKGCVEGAKQSQGSFENPGDVEVRKLVTKTDNPGEYQIDIAVRGKDISTTTTTENNVCAAVVFDKSGSMKDKDGKWDSAVKGAKSFAQTLVGKNSKAKIGLITFSTRADTGRTLAHKNFESVGFGSPDGGTNLHAGLLEAGKMLDTLSCKDAKKYVVVMSDGEPTFFLGEPVEWHPNDLYGNGDNDEKVCVKKEKKCGVLDPLCRFPTWTCLDYKKPSEVANEQAQILKAGGVEIFSVGYEVETGGNAEKVLTAIASENTPKVSQHYFSADGTSVANAFDNIATTVTTANAGTYAVLTDTLGNGIQLEDGTSGSETVQVENITEEGFVHSFQIRIDPSKTEDQATNGKLTLDYTDPQGNSKSLMITGSAKVHWQLPACSGERPTENAIFGLYTFPQKWVEGKLDPQSKSWKAVAGTGELGACEWRCEDGYHAENGQCMLNKKSCDISNGLGEMIYENGQWGICKVVSCNGGYHLEENACKPNKKPCDVPNGQGEMTYENGQWGACEVVSCNDGYHLENNNSQGELRGAKGVQCVSNTKKEQCSGNIPSEAAALTGHGEFTQTWNGTIFAPAVMTWTNGGNECGFACKENYTYNPANNTCVANTQACNVENGTGTQTWNGNGWGACENIQCAPNYHNVSDKCKADQKPNQTCNSIPNNAQWLAGNNGTVTQTWDGLQQAWLPSLTGNYNKMGIQSNGGSCDFQCKANYTWNQDTKACEAKKLENQQCTGLVENAIWGNQEGAMSITQVWSGTANAYLPSLTGSYNPQPSDSACEFKCLDNYTWDAQTQTCKKEKLENQSCTGLVANAQWRGQGVVTQVWSGTANTYLPSLAGSYNPQGDVNACHFKCERDFTRKNGKCEKVSNGGGSFSGGGSSGGGGTLTKDNCPNGDFSPSYYDGQCGTPGDQEEVVLSGEVNDCSIEGSPFSEEENIAFLYACQNDITTIKDINDARLNDLITRAEMAKMITHFVTTKLNKVPNAEKDCSAFSQSIAPYSQEMQDYMTKACQLDIMGVYPDYRPLSDFMPFKNVIRAEFGTVLSRVLFGSAYEGTEEAWYQSHLNILKKTGILSVTEPTILERRSWVFRMIYKSAQALKLVK